MSFTQQKNPYTAIGELDANIPPSSLLLKLSVTDDSVRYFVQSLAHDQVIFFAEYVLHHIETEDQLFQKLERIIASDEILQLPFARVFIGLDPSYSIMPQGFLEPPESSTHLTFNQKIETGGLELIYTVDGQFHSRLSGLFSNCSVTHLNSALLKVLPGYIGTSSPRLFTRVNPGFVDIAYFGRFGNVLLMNRYDYQTPSDLIYYILLCCEELKIEREETELMLSGEVDLNSQVHDLCYLYFNQVSLIQPTGNVHFSKAFDDFPKHRYFNLFNLGT